jgi:hypothetical protein
MCACVRVDLTIPALVGIKKLPQKDDYNEFDITSLVGGLFFALILHQLLPVFLSVLHFLLIEELTMHHSTATKLTFIISAEPGLREGKQNQGDDEDGTTYFAFILCNWLQHECNECLLSRYRPSDGPSYADLLAGELLLVLSPLLLRGGVPHHRRSGVSYVPTPHNT